MNHNYLTLKEDNQKLLETEKKMINESIIFKNRLFNNKKQTKNSVSKKRGKKDLSVKNNNKYSTKSQNNINAHTIYNSSKRKKKSSFKTFNNISMNNCLKNSSIKKNNKMVLNKNTNNTLNNNSYKSSKKHKQNRLNLILNYNDKNILKTMNTSPRISNINLDDGYISSIERSKYYLNTYRDSEKENINKNEEQKFNYRKWNKIIINNIFDNEKKNNNEYAQKSIEYDIYKNGNSIQDAIANNITKQKTISDIPINTNKNKDRNNIFKYCKQMSNLSLFRKNNSNYIGQILSGLKSDQFGRQNNINNMTKKRNIHINKNKNIKNNKSRNKKTISSERLSIDMLPYYFNYPQLDFKNQNIKNSSKNNYLNISYLSPKSNNNISANLNKNDNNKDNKYNLNSRNNNNKNKEEFISRMNTQVIKMKNNKLMESIKTDESKNINIDEINNININMKEKIIKKGEFGDIKEENNIKTKNELYKGEIFNSNTDLLTEKDKGCNFYNKTSIDNIETSFKIINNCNNNNNNTNIYKNKNNFKDLLYSPKHNIFTKKIIGCINMNNTNKKNNNDDNNKNINLMQLNNNNIKFKEQNKIDEKEVTFNIKIDNCNHSNIESNNNINNKEYMELAQKCAKQEKIIYDLMNNVQQLNSQIYDKDLFINELNNQIYSIKYDLLNTLKKTNSSN